MSGYKIIIPVAAILALVLAGGFSLVSGKDTKSAAWFRLSQIQDYFSSAGEPEKYSWNQEVTLEIEHEGVLYTDSTVMKITWTENQVQINDGKWIPSYRGEMPFIILPDGTHVVAMNANGLGSLAQNWLIRSDRKQKSPTRDQLNTISSESVILLPSNVNFPYLVAFTEPSDPESSEYYDTEGSRIIVQKTSATVTDIRMDEVFVPWLPSLGVKSVRSMPTVFQQPDGAYVAVYKQHLYSELDE